MHAIYDLKETLCDELEGYGNKKLDTGSLDVIDKLAHTIKNLDKIIECYESSDYSGRGSYDDGMGGTYAMRGSSYARGRGMNARRDSMGRYSRGKEDFRSELMELMEDAPNDHIKQKIKSLMSEM